MDDAVAGRMLCEVLAATEQVQPTFGHELGNTWLTNPGNGSLDGCDFANPQQWRACIGRNVAKQSAMIVVRMMHDQPILLVFLPGVS